MSIKSQAIVRTADNVVTNIVVVDTANAWQPPPDSFAQDDDGTARIGGSFSVGTFFPPPAPLTPEGPWFAILAGDLTMSSNVLADVAGMSFQLYPNKKYLFDCELWFRTAATTTGILFSATGPASPVAVDLMIETALTMPATNAATYHQQRITAYDGGTPTASIDVANTDRLCRISGLIQNGPNAGLLKLRWRSEVNASQVTLRTGSRARIMAV